MKDRVSKVFFGSEEVFDPEHRFLNFSLIFVVFMFLITFPYSFHYNLKTTIINGIISLFFLSLYIISRFRRKLIFPAIGFFIGTLTFLSSSWITAGGISGGTPYYYFSLLVVILFICKGKIRIILSIIVIFEFYFMLMIEYFYPEFITNYNSLEEKNWDVGLSFITAIPFVIGSVFYSKLLWMSEKKNTKYLIEQYRKSSEYLKNEFQQRIQLLSVREREIFKLVIEGCTNKEIASNLFIEERTVKNHITSIYKKIEVKRRNEIINKIQNG